MIIIIGIMLVIALVFFVFLKTSPQKNPAGGEYEIELEELSQVWLKYNKEYAPLSAFESVDYNEENEVFEKLIKQEETKVFNASSEAGNETKKITTPQKAEETVSGSLKANTGQTAVEGGSVSTQQKSDPSLVEDIDMLGSFYRDVIKPYEDKFKEQNVYDVLVNILRMLEKHGSIPSVVIDAKDGESVDLISVRDNLAMVTLKEHTFTVARIMEGLVRQNQMDYENFMPQYIITALAHDIGKIPELRLSGLYNSYDHATVSSNWLAEQFVGKDVFWVRQAVVAVRDHHLKSREPLTQLLKEADKQARQMELIRYASQYRIEPFDKWFDLEEFTQKYLEPEINISQKTRWEAFSFKGVIYIRPDALYELVKKYAFAQKVIDSELLYESEKEEVLKKVIQKYREKQLVPDFIGEGYFSRKFEIKTKLSTGKKQTFVLTAVRGDLIDLEKVESRKHGSGFIELIEAVTPQ